MGTEMSIPHPEQGEGPTCVLWSFLNPAEGSAGTSEALTAYLQGETRKNSAGNSIESWASSFWEGELRMCTKNGIFLLFPL